MLASVVVLALGCVGYGSVFLAVGVYVRNPIIPAAVLLIWEGATLNVEPETHEAEVAALDASSSVKRVCRALAPIPNFPGTPARDRA
jgi:hypothetical protein